MKKKVEFKRKTYANKIMGLCYADILNIREGATLLGMNKETFRRRYKEFKAEKEKEIIDLDAMEEMEV